MFINDVCGKKTELQYERNHFKYDCFTPTRPLPVTCMKHKSPVHFFPRSPWHLTCCLSVLFSIFTGHKRWVTGLAQKCLLNRNCPVYRKWSFYFEGRNYCDVKNSIRGYAEGLRQRFESPTHRLRFLMWKQNQREQREQSGFISACFTLYYSLNQQSLSIQTETRVRAPPAGFKPTCVEPIITVLLRKVFMYLLLTISSFSVLIY